MRLEDFRLQAISLPTNYATHECIGHKNDLTKSAKVGKVGGEKRLRNSGNCYARIRAKTLLWACSRRHNNN